MSQMRDRASELLRGYHEGQIQAPDEALDIALGLPEQSWTRSAKDHPRLQSEHPGESVVNVATPYDACRRLFDVVSPGSKDRVYDLGCGSGRVLLYGALLTEAQFVGVEIVESRASEARAAVATLGLANVEVVVGNVLEQDLELGTIFYAFRPFSVESEALVLERLHAIGCRKAITLATYRMQPSLFDRQVFEREDHGALLIHRSHGAPGDARVG